MYVTATVSTDTAVTALVGIDFDTDCDGLSVAFHDLTNAKQIEYEYDQRSYDDTITRDQFMEHVFPTIDEWSQQYFLTEGYWCDSSGIRNCEITHPVMPSVIPILERLLSTDDPSPVENGYF